MPRTARLFVAALAALAYSATAPALQAQAAQPAQPAGSLVIVTRTVNPTTSVFGFALFPAAATGARSVSVTGAGSVTLPYAATSSLSISESVPASFGPVTISCQLNGAAVGFAWGSAIIGVRISPNKVTTCTFSQSARPVSAATTVGFSPSSLGHLGGDTTESWTVRNTSAFPVRLARLWDSRLGPLTASGCQVGTVLAAGASCGGSVTQWISQVAGGTATSTFTADVASAAGATATSTSSAKLTFLLPSGALRVVREVSPTQLPAAGGWATVTISVANVGATPVTLGTFEDTQFGSFFDGWYGLGPCHAGTVLALGQSCALQAPFWFSGPSGSTMTATTWIVATTSTGAAVLGEGSSSVAFS